MIPEDRRRVWRVGEVLEGLGSRGASLLPHPSRWCALGWGRESQGDRRRKGSCSCQREEVWGKSGDSYAREKVALVSGWRAQALSGSHVLISF